MKRLWKTLLDDWGGLREGIYEAHHYQFRLAMPWLNDDEYYRLLVKRAAEERALLNISEFQPPNEYPEKLREEPEEMYQDVLELINHDSLTHYA